MKGSCLCGAVEYEIDSIDTPILHCHCRACQKAHAAPFATTAGVMREHFRWLNGEDKLSSFESKLYLKYKSKILFLGWRRCLRACFITHVLQNLMLGFFIHNDDGNAPVNRVQWLCGRAVGYAGR